ncbi:hypothetical protein KY285_030299 [Solanum tuberosum]|nr:hypothetical protein KY285_030299 [Solanum tuberosum]
MDENGKNFNPDPCPKNGPPLKSGQVILVQVDSIVIRSAKPYLATPGATVHGHYGETLYEGDTLVTFIYEKSRSGDITQGLPKVEQVLEVRSIDSISMNLEKRVESWNKCIPRILGIPWGFLIGAELTIAQSRISLVNKIQQKMECLMFFHPENLLDCCKQNEWGALWKKRSVTESSYWE